MFQIDNASFRDPAAFVFVNENGIYRQINQVYREAYDKLMTCGLYEELCGQGKLITHSEMDMEAPVPETAYKIIRPEPISFISYPYEWCFSQLKEAALLTLEIQQLSLNKGLSLKDASAYNIQFHHGKPVFIDTASFEPYIENIPWVAYRQFCSHFLAPLLIMRYTDCRMNQLLKSFLDGIPLDMAYKLLPFRVKLHPMVFMNICLHAQAQSYYNQKKHRKHSSIKIPKRNLILLLNSLHNFISTLESASKKTEWSDYYEEVSYSAIGFESKKQIVEGLLKKIQPRSLWDFGANTGEFSRKAAELGIHTVAFDKDPGTVERNYQIMKNGNEKMMLPLVMDLTNPSPSIGWSNQERKKLTERGQPDLLLVLALIHHLYFSCNISFEKMASFFSGSSKSMIIEFVPSTDPKVMQMLQKRDASFQDYTVSSFEASFCRYYRIIEKVPVKDSERILYWMAR